MNRTTIRVPLRMIPRAGLRLGDLVAAATRAVGIKPCKGCDRRREVLNRYIVQGTKRE